jgi:ATP-dependent DNA ligase
VDHVRERGRDLYALACAHDTEGIVGKWAAGRYSVDGTTTSWLKIKNPAYTQAIGRHELFEGRRSTGSGRSSPKAYRLDPAAPAAPR